MPATTKSIRITNPEREIHIHENRADPRKVSTPVMNIHNPASTKARTKLGSTPSINVDPNQAAKPTTPAPTVPSRVQYRDRPEGSRQFSAPIAASNDSEKTRIKFQRVGAWKRSKEGTC